MYQFMVVKIPSSLAFIFFVRMPDSCILSLPCMISRFRLCNLIHTRIVFDAWSIYIACNNYLYAMNYESVTTLLIHDDLFITSVILNCSLNSTIMEKLVTVCAYLGQSFC